MELRQVGKFKIVDKLGQGAMGEVFRALDPVLGREVAIKVVTGKLSADEGARVRFQREAQSAAQLNHPNIITVYDFGEEQGMAFMAMELLEGSDLRELLAEGKVASLEDKLAIMEQILDGLAFAHAKGVVHRDLKPGNVHVLPNGQVKIMDFGLARRAQDGAATGVIMGTPYYMAPEQVRGERATARSDIFSLGAMFYEMLGGKRPFPGPTIPAVLFAVVHRDPEPLAAVAPDVSEGLAAVVMRALSKTPEARYADAGEMLQALRVAWAGGDAAAAGAGSAWAAADQTPARALSPAFSALPDTPVDLRAAVEEIDQYLADRVPPLVVADSVAVFVEAPVEGAAAELQGWAERQQAMQPDLPLVDLLFHALRKLSVIGEFHLVEGEQLLGFLRAVGQALAEACPPGADRDRFRRALSHLGESEMVSSGPIEMMRRSAEPPPTEPSPAPATPGLRRLSILEQRLRREGIGQGPAADTARRRVVSQAIAAAATEAKSEKELEDHLRRLRAAGVESGAGQVFRSLGQELADWALPKGIASDTADLGLANEVQAMKQIVSLPEDPIEVARRYRHLVSAATEQFNEGNLGRAVQMFELATKLASEKKVEAGFMEPILRKGHEALDEKRLRQYMDKPDRHAQLQAVMDFFGPGLGAASLLDQLETEERRDRRRLLLDLLVVQGDAARALARARLEASLQTAASDFGRRNWIYLLRVVPRPAGDPIEVEIDAVARFATPGNPAFLAKEALTHLGQARHPRAARGARLAARGLGSRARARGPRRGGARGGPRRSRPHRLRHRAPGRAKRLARPRRARPLRPARARGHRLPPRRAGRARPLLEPRGGPDPAGQDQRQPAARCPGPAGGAQGPGPARPRGRPRRHAHPRGPRAARGGAQALPGAGVRQGGGARARRAAPGHGARRGGGSLGRARALRPPGAPPPPRPGQGQRHAQPAAAGGRRRPGHDRPLAGPSGERAVGAPGGGGGRLPPLRADVRRQLRFRPGGGPGRRGGGLPDLPALVKEGVRRARELQRTSAVVPEELPLEATGASPGTVVDETDYDLIVALWEKACARVSGPPDRGRARRRRLPHPPPPRPVARGGRAADRGPARRRGNARPRHVSVTAPGSIGGRAEPFARYRGLRPGLITKRWPKSPWSSESDVPERAGAPFHIPMNSRAVFQPVGSSPSAAVIASGSASMITLTLAFSLRSTGLSSFRTPPPS